MRMQSVCRNDDEILTAAALPVAIDVAAASHCIGRGSMAHCFMASLQSPSYVRQQRVPSLNRAAAPTSDPTLAFSNMRARSSLLSPPPRPWCPAWCVGLGVTYSELQYLKKTRHLAALNKSVVLVECTAVCLALLLQLFDVRVLHFFAFAFAAFAVVSIPIQRHHV